MSFLLQLNLSIVLTGLLTGFYHLPCTSGAFFNSNSGCMYRDDTIYINASAYDGTCYFATTTTNGVMEYTNARQVCTTYGAVLLYWTSRADLLFFLFEANSFSNGDAIWTGLQRLAGGSDWSWYDQTLTPSNGELEDLVPGFANYNDTSNNTTDQYVYLIYSNETVTSAVGDIIEANGYTGCRMRQVGLTYTDALFYYPLDNIFEFFIPLTLDAVAPEWKWATVTGIERYHDEPRGNSIGTVAGQESHIQIYPYSGTCTPTKLECTDGFTFAFWFKLPDQPDSSIQEYYIDTGIKDGGTGFAMFHNLGKLVFEVQLTSRIFALELELNSDIPINQWTHIIMSFGRSTTTKSSEITVFVDKIQQSGVASKWDNGTDNQGVSIIIGDDGVALYDEIALWDRVLNSTERESIYEDDDFATSDTYIDTSNYEYIWSQDNSVTATEMSTAATTATTVVDSSTSILFAVGRPFIPILPSEASATTENPATDEITTPAPQKVITEPIFVVDPVIFPIPEEEVSSPSPATTETGSRGTTGIQASSEVSDINTGSATTKTEPGPTSQDLMSPSPATTGQTGSQAMTGIQASSEVSDINTDSVTTMTEPGPTSQDLMTSRAGLTSTEGPSTIHMVETTQIPNSGGTTGSTLAAETATSTRRSTSDTPMSTYELKTTKTGSTEIEQRTTAAGSTNQVTTATNAHTRPASDPLSTAEMITTEAESTRESTTDQVSTSESMLSTSVVNTAGPSSESATTSTTERMTSVESMLTETSSTVYIAITSTEPSPMISTTDHARSVESMLTESSSTVNTARTSTKSSMTPTADQVTSVESVLTSSSPTVNTAGSSTQSAMPSTTNRVVTVESTSIPASSTVNTAKTSTQSALTSTTAQISTAGSTLTPSPSTVNTAQTSTQSAMPLTTAQISTAGSTLTPGSSTVNTAGSSTQPAMPPATAQISTAGSTLTQSPSAVNTATSEFTDPMSTQKTSTNPIFTGSLLTTQEASRSTTIPPTPGSKETTIDITPRSTHSTDTEETTTQLTTSAEEMPSTLSTPQASTDKDSSSDKPTTDDSVSSETQTVYPDASESSHTVTLDSGSSETDQPRTRSGLPTTATPDSQTEPWKTEVDSSHLSTSIAKSIPTGKTITTQTVPDNPTGIPTATSPELTSQSKEATSQIIAELQTLVNTTLSTGNTDSRTAAQLFNSTAGLADYSSADPEDNSLLVTSAEVYIELAGHLVKSFSNYTVEEATDVLVASLSVVDSLVSPTNAQKWTTVGSNLVAQITQTAELMAVNLAERADNTTESIVLTSKHLVTVIDFLHLSDAPTPYTFPKNASDASHEATFEIPTGVFASHDAKAVVAQLYHSLGPLLQDVTESDGEEAEGGGNEPQGQGNDDKSQHAKMPSSVVGSKVLTVTLVPPLQTSIDKAIQFGFQLQPEVIASLENKTALKMCSFWNFTLAQDGSWSDSGCRVSSHNETHVRCSCDHMTSFAVLVQVVDVEISDADSRALDVISLVGCMFSIVGTFLTCITYLFLRMTSERTLIHFNLSVAIMMAQVAFLFQDTTEKQTIACVVLTVIMYYSNMAVFCWMLIEGVQIYFQVVIVFVHAERLKMYLLIGWGLPLIFTIITTAILRESLGMHGVCWLSFVDYSIWFFAVPVIIVILINFCILVRVTRVILTLSRAQGGSKIDSAKKSVKASIMLLPLLGCTWVFGFLCVTGSTIIFHYLFAICNSFQGFFLFLAYCALSTEVRDSWNKRREDWSLSRSINTQRSKVHPHTRQGWVDKTSSTQ